MQTEEVEKSIEIETSEYFAEVAKGVPLVADYLREVKDLPKYKTQFKMDITKIGMTNLNLA